MGNFIAKSAIIHPNVQLGNDVVVEDFCVIGIPPRGGDSTGMQTIIGDGAVIRSHTVIYAGNRIGVGFQTGNKANVRENNVIGDNVSIGTMSVIEHHVTIADNVRIHTQVFIPEFSVLEEGCWVGPNVVLTNARYPNSPDAKHQLAEVTLKRGAILGANVTVLPGVTIASRSLIGAGSVVVADTQPGGVYYGNPARLTNSINKLPYPAAQS